MSLSYAVLGLLSDRPMTGYDLKLVFDKEMNSFWPAQLSQIYRELSTLVRSRFAAFGQGKL